MLDKFSIYKDNEMMSNGEIYDAFENNQVSIIRDEIYKDILFWKNLFQDASKNGKVNSILDVGCGTGRIAIPLAESNFTLVGVDLSSSMLAKASANNKKNKDIKWIREDFNKITLNNCFSHILMSNSFFFHNLTIPQAKTCLKKAWNLLEEGGTLIIDVLHPTLDFMTGLNDTLPVIRSVFKDPLDSNEIIIVSRTRKYDSSSQIITTFFDFHFTESHKNIYDQIIGKIFFPQELEAILDSNGFKIYRKYGGYDFSTFDRNSCHCIIQCKKYTN